MANMLQTKVLDEHIDTLWTIAASRWIDGFIIGYTCQSRRERFKSYKADGWHGMVVLENGLTRDQALDLERRLQETCKRGLATGEPYRRKYAPYHRELPHYASSGQGSTEPDAPIHSVYIVWYYK